MAVIFMIWQEFDTSFCKVNQIFRFSMNPLFQTMSGSKWPTLIEKLELTIKVRKTVWIIEQPCFWFDMVACTPR